MQILKKILLASFKTKRTVCVLGHYNSINCWNPWFGVLHHMTLKIQKTYLKSIAKQLQALFVFKGGQSCNSWSGGIFLLKVLVTKWDNRMGGDISIVKVVFYLQTAWKRRKSKVGRTDRRTDTVTYWSRCPRQKSMLRPWWRRKQKPPRGRFCSNVEPCFSGISLGRPCPIVEAGEELEELFAAIKVLLGRNESSSLVQRVWLQKMLESS